MYKTIAELLNLGAVEAGVMGSSFAPLVTVDPSASHAMYAFSQYPRCPAGADCMMFDAVGITAMGYSVRSATIRYTEWRSWQNASLTGDWSAAGLIGAELYPHMHDPRLLPTDFDSSMRLLGSISTLFGRSELDLRGHTHVRGAAVSCLRLNGPIWC